jgi:hypothetical protein
MSAKRAHLLLPLKVYKCVDVLGGQRLTCDCGNLQRWIKNHVALYSGSRHVQAPDEGKSSSRQYKPKNPRTSRIHAS